MTHRIIIGDALESLRGLPDQSVHCCVTSPPYYGLRDYKAEGQLGMEKSPQQFVDNLVGVFREVRRVLRDDGTLWLNLGSSYASGDISAIPSPRLLRAPACGSGGIAPDDSSDAGLACPDCGGGLTACSQNHPRHNARNDQPRAQSWRLTSRKGHDSGKPDFEEAFAPASAGGAHLSTSPSSRQSAPAASGHGDAALECPTMPATSSGCVQAFSGSLACNGDTVQSAGPSVSGTLGTACVCLACGYSTRMSQKYKAKDLINIPFLVAEALRADGWWLRQDIIWSKGNPMPESVKDRCTKSHEYIFMLSKKPKYFYDHKAIMEPCVSRKAFRFVDGGDDKQRGHSRRHAGFNGRYKESVLKNGAPSHRNRRSVWQVNTSPYRGAHFATYPPRLIEPCILAGCPEGGIVLDPFAGSGTTGMVAKLHRRDSILIDLNPANEALMRERLDIQPNIL